MKRILVSLLAAALLSVVSMAASQFEITFELSMLAMASQDPPCSDEDPCATPESTPVASAASGIQGQVFIGPTCPVVRSDRDCADRPYQASIAVLDADGTLVTRVQTDEQGRFRIDLAPGDYTLHLESPGALPRAQDQPVRVTEEHYTQIDIHYDSGIR